VSFLPILLNILKAALRETGPLFGFNVIYKDPLSAQRAPLPREEQGRGKKELKNDIESKASWHFLSPGYRGRGARRAERGRSQAPNSRYCRACRGNPDFLVHLFNVKKQIWVPAINAGMAKDLSFAVLKN
jgi:hypothetical protein